MTLFQPVIFGFIFLANYGLLGKVNNSNGSEIGFFSFLLPCYPQIFSLDNHTIFQSETSKLLNSNLICGKYFRKIFVIWIE
jgi:hypothetical protein